MLEGKQPKSTADAIKAMESVLEKVDFDWTRCSDSGTDTNCE